MSDDVSMIDAVKAVAKATREDPDKMASLVKGALHTDQIDDLRVMLSKTRDGSITHWAAAAPSTAAAASAASEPRVTSVQRRAWKANANKVSAKFQGAPPGTAEGDFPPLGPARPANWRQVGRAPSRPRVSRRAEMPHPTLFATDAEVAAMSPDSRLIHEQQLSLQRQKEQMELRHRAEADR